MIGTTAYPNDLATAIQGYEYTGPGWTPALPAAINAAAPARCGSDVLVVRVPVGIPGSRVRRLRLRATSVALYGGVLRQRHRLHRGLQRVGGAQDFSLRRHEPPPYRRCQQQRLSRTGLRGRRARHALRDARLLRRAEQPQSRDRNLSLDDDRRRRASRGRGGREGLRFNTARTPTPTMPNVLQANNVVDFTGRGAAGNLLLRGAASTRARSPITPTTARRVPADRYAARVHGDDSTSEPNAMSRLSHATE